MNDKTSLPEAFGDDSPGKRAAWAAFVDDLARYLDGELSEEETVRLCRDLSSDPGLRTEFLKARWIDSELRRLLAPGATPRAFAEALARSPSGRRQSPSEFARAVRRKWLGARKPRRWTWLAPVAAAAAALVIAAAILFTGANDRLPRRVALAPGPSPAATVEPTPPEQPVPQPKLEHARPLVEPRQIPERPEALPPQPQLTAPRPSPDPPPEAPPPDRPTVPPPAPIKEPDRSTVLPALAKLDRISGRVFVAEEKAEAGRPLRQGDRIRTDETSRAWVSFPDATRLRVWEGTELSFVGPGKRIAIKGGHVSAEVTRQLKTDPLVLSSRIADAEVVGTRFAVLDRPEGTRLDVEEGSVRFTRRQDKQGVRVGAGYYAQASDGGPAPVSRLVPAVLFQENFAALALDRPPHGWDIPQGHFFHVASAKGRRALAVGEKGLDSKTLQRAGIPWRIERERFAIQFRFSFSDRKASRVGLKIDPGGWTVEYDGDAGAIRLAAPETKPLAQRAAALQPGVWHMWRVEARGKRLRLLVDGQEAIAQDMEPLEEARSASLIYQGSSPVLFDDVQIFRLGP